MKMGFLDFSIHIMFFFFHSQNVETPPSQVAPNYNLIESSSNKERSEKNI